LYDAASAPDATQQQGTDFLKSYGKQQVSAVQSQQDLTNRDYADTLEGSEFAQIDPTDGSGRGKLISDIPEETFIDTKGGAGGADLRDMIATVAKDNQGLPGWMLDRAIKQTGITEDWAGDKEFSTAALKDNLQRIRDRYNQFTAARTRNRDINLDFEAQKSNIATDSANILKNYSSGVGSRNRGELLKNLR
jgi:hypothetical protein